MEFDINFLSFYVIQIDNETDTKQYTHYQTMDMDQSNKVRSLPF